IEIGNSLLSQFNSILFCPFCGSEQTVFLSVPAAQHDRPPWLPSVLKKLAKRAARFQHRSGTAIGIDRTKRPGITVIAHHNPTVLFITTVNPGHQIPDLSDLIVHFSFQMNLNVVSTADVIRNRQPTLETSGPQ